jgi:predicted PurR-regulated permease PerM
MLAILGVITVAGVILCYRLASPFLPALTFAIALAVVARPMHLRIARRLDHPSIAAILSVVLVTAIVVLPLAFATHQLAQEAIGIFRSLQADGGESSWKALLQQLGSFGPVLEWIDRQLSLRGQLETFSQFALTGLKTAWTLSIGVVIGGLITLFFLFYFFRDGQRLMNGVCGYLPLSPEECGRVLDRIDDTIHAMIFGSLGVAFIQGCLGGLMFWWLGLPSPLVWSAVMCVCAVLPVFGASLVWVPAALFFLVTGETANALILVLWGAIVVSLIDNLLYPVLVRNQLRLHTVLVFVAIVGGIVVFGAAGLILGPVVLAVTKVLLGVWGDRMRATAPSQ